MQGPSGGLTCCHRAQYHGEVLKNVLQGICGRVQGMQGWFKQKDISDNTGLRNLPAESHRKRSLIVIDITNSRSGQEIRISANSDAATNNEHTSKGQKALIMTHVPTMVLAKHVWVLMICASSGFSNTRSMH